MNSKLPPSRLTKSLTAGSYRAKDSYLASCPRDESGHCLPQNEADRSGRGKPGADAKPAGGAGGVGEKPTGAVPAPNGHEPGGSPEANKQAKAMAAEPTVPPSTKHVFSPDVMVKGAMDVTRTARCGVPGMSVPPPPKNIPRLPNLTADERKVEEEFAQRYEADHEAMIAKYDELRQKVVGKNKDGSDKYAVGDGPNIFATDDAKVLSPYWSPPPDADVSPEEMMANRGRYNLALHQTANAIAKKSFLKHLDSLPEGKKSVMVTAGGCGAGKGYAIGNINEVTALKDAVGAVWDSAGDQNSTELPWLLQECKKRGIKLTCAYIHADPKKSWAHPGMGVVSRAKKVGRMVDAHVFTDSYALGASNFHAFQQAVGNEADFIYIDNSGPPHAPKDENGNPKPFRVDKMPDSALNLNREELYNFSRDVVTSCGDCSSAIKRGATIGERIWGPLKEKQAKGLRYRIKAQPLGRQQHADHSLADILLHNMNTNLANLDEFYRQEREQLDNIPQDQPYDLDPPPLKDDGTLVDKGSPRKPKLKETRLKRRGE